MYDLRWEFGWLSRAFCTFGACKTCIPHRISYKNFKSKDLLPLTSFFHSFFRIIQHFLWLFFQVLRCVCFYCSKLLLDKDNQRVKDVIRKTQGTQAIPSQYLFADISIGFFLYKFCAIKFYLKGILDEGLPWFMICASQKSFVTVEMKLKIQILR